MQEKYGPKDGSNGSAQKPKSSQALKAGDVDLSIGLSTNAPWNCRSKSSFNSSPMPTAFVSNLLLINGIEVFQKIHSEA